MYLRHFFLLWMILCNVAALRAAEWSWELPGRAWTKTEPPKVWRFYAVPRNGTGLTDAVELTMRDFNARANRLMCSAPDGDPWSLPAVRVEQFSLPGEQLLTLHSAAKSDAAAVFECRVAGELSWEVVLTDPVPPDAPGSDGNAMFSVRRVGRTETETLASFSWRGQRELRRNGRVKVQPGDRLALVKTATEADDFGRRAVQAAFKVDLIDSVPTLDWRAAAIPANRILTDEAIPLPGKLRTDRTASFISGRAVPCAQISRTGDQSELIVARAEKDAVSPDSCGDLLLLKTVPQSGVWRIALSGGNVGLDRKGGDGGMLTLLHLPPGSRALTSQLRQLRLPPSREGATETVRADCTVKLNAGDRLVLRFHANRDGYADRFEVKFELAPVADTAGTVTPEPPTADQILPAANSPRRPAGIPMRPGLFWLGTDGGWLTGKYAPESIELIRSFVPELAVIGVNNRPDRTPEPEYFRRNNIPSLVQHFGSGYEPYWRHEGAFEWDHHGVSRPEPDAVALSGMAHAIALPHPAAIEAFDRLARAGVRAGYSGYGFNDMVWYWGPGRGVTGYHPATVKAFRQSLAGEDDGIAVAWGGARTRLFHFADYAEFYLGFRPRPEFVGLRQWSEYHPLWAEEKQQRLAAGKEISAELLLFDLLVHYEWLKTADRIGRAAKAEGGVFQVLPNPEDLANGCDFLFLAGLSNVYARTEEYFQSPLFMNGAYHRFPYFRERTGRGNECGVVLEGGAGGNNRPYYESAMSLQLAYEITLAAELDHLEGDFWPSNADTIDRNIANPTVQTRYQAILAYALGFRFGREDAGLCRLKPDFLSITSRRLFRPWGDSWYVWNWKLDTQFSPDQLLARQGYIPAGQGEESLAEPQFAAPVVLYSAAPPTAAGWRNFMRHLENGNIRHGVVMAEALQTMLGDEMRPVPFPYLTMPPGGALSGDLKQPGGAPAAHGLRVEKSFRAPPGFQTEWQIGDTPVVVSRDFGKGTLHVLLFTPTPRTAGAETPDAAAGQAVYRELLAKLGCTPHWRSADPVEARLYRKDDLMLVSAMRHDCLKTRQNGLYPAVAPTEAALELRLEPGRDYQFLTFPGLRQGTTRSGADGFAPLPLGKATTELFFLLPPESPRRAELFDRLRRRAAEFDRAMRLNR